MADHLTIGVLGEQCAAAFLESIGCAILDRNVRTKFGELDIIAHDPEGVLLVVEVKTLARSGSLYPEDNLTRAKLSKLTRMATFYANRYPDLVNDTRGWRIDLIAITLNPLSGAGIYHFGNTAFAVSHYKNIAA